MVVVLVLTGLVSVEQLREFRGYVIVGIFVVAAIVTPPDVVSQIALAVPMCLLYEAGIIAARFVAKRKAPEYQPLTEAEKEHELDRIAAQEKKDNV
ncbi:Sec-independent protein translocase protein TatC [compost metagenome]